MSTGIQTDLFGTQVEVARHYLLAINPPKNISDYVNNEKKELIGQLGEWRYGLTSKPHITLASFAYLSSREDTLIMKLGELANEAKPFSVEMNGFGTFPSNGTIYLSVERQNLNFFYRRLCEVLYRMPMTLSMQFSKSYTPHITIIRNLNENQEAYHQFWNDYQSRTYTGVFNFNGFVLLRYRQDEIKTDVVKEFVVE